MIYLCNVLGNRYRTFFLSLFGTYILRLELIQDLFLVLESSKITELLIICILFFLIHTIFALISEFMVSMTNANVNTVSNYGNRS